MRSRCLDIGQALFAVSACVRVCVFLMYRDEVQENKDAKRKEARIYYMVKKVTTSCGSNTENPERARCPGSKLKHRVRSILLACGHSYIL